MDCAPAVGLIVGSAAPGTDEFDGYVRAARDALYMLQYVWKCSPPVPGPLVVPVPRELNKPADAIANWVIDSGRHEYLWFADGFDIREHLHERVQFFVSSDGVYSTSSAGQKASAAALVQLHVDGSPICFVAVWAVCLLAVSSLHSEMGFLLAARLAVQVTRRSHCEKNFCTREGVVGP
jgi:hypothetical protein